MASLSWIVVILIGFIVGGITTLILLALVRETKPTKNLCPRCKEETEEENQLKKDWADQQKGYN